MAPWLQRVARRTPGRQATIEHAHIAHAGTQQQQRQARGGQRVAAIQDDAAGRAQAQALHPLQQRGRRQRIPVRRLFPRLRVHKTGTRNMAAGIGRLALAADFPQLPVRRWCRSQGQVALPQATPPHWRLLGGLAQQGRQPVGAHQLTPARQVGTKTGRCRWSKIAGEHGA
jgi:hypothetical protein